MKENSCMNYYKTYKTFLKIWYVNGTFIMRSSQPLKKSDKRSLGLGNSMCAKLLGEQKTWDAQQKEGGR